MNNEPNVTAAKFYENYELTYIRNDIPDVKFYVFGANHVAEVRQLAQMPNVCVTGKVSDVGDYMRQAAISVAPMCSGAGIQNKILQAMSFGGCVVTTTIGAEGLDINQSGIVVRDSAKELADAIVSLLRNPSQRAQIGKRAIDYVRRNLVAEIIEKQVAEFLS